MRGGWTRPTLISIANIQQGKTLAKIDMTGGDHDVFGANGVIGRYTSGHYTFDVIGVGCRGTCGSVHIARAGSFLANNVMGVWPKDVESVSLGYLTLALENTDFRGEGIVSGQVQPQITRESLAGLKISCPSLAEQQRIVDLIGSLDEAIEAADVSSEMTRLGMDTVADSLIFAGARWPETKVRDVAEKRGLIGGPFGSSLVSTDYVEHGVPVIRGKNMPTSEAFVDGPFVFVSDEKADSLHRNQAVPGDVIFTQRGTLGQVGLVPADGPSQYVISQSQMRLRVSEVALSEFVFYAFRSPRMVAHMKGLNSATANPHINLGTLAEVAFPLPPIEEQIRIVEILGAAMTAATESEESATSLRHLRTNLLTALLSGTHEIPESYDDLLSEAV